MNKYFHAISSALHEVLVCFSGILYVSFRLFSPRNFICIFLFSAQSAFAEVKVSYGVPEGFSAVEMDNSARYAASFNGHALPGLVSYSIERGRLVFDPLEYIDGKLSKKDRETLDKVLSGVDYKKCELGCDLQVADHYVRLDKQRRTLNIVSSREDFVRSETTWGIVNNQSLDYRSSSDGYRSMNINGNTWFGLPSQSFAYINWYANHNQSRGANTHNQAISSYFVQKNFSGTYVRTGKQDALDYASGSINTLLAPSFDQFITIGSQDHLLTQRDTGSLVLYSIGEGSYEFYRNGRMIFKRPAVLGRNEFSYSDLPGGYYPIEVRLVDRNGNVLNSETRDINNLNFGGGGRRSWHITGGKELETGGQLLQASASQNLSQFYLNASAVSGERSRKAAELNLTRPSQLGSINVTPTLGLLSGEKGTGGYFDLSANDDLLGSFMFSRYQSTNISDFYYGTPSTAVSYSRSFGSTMFSYNYQKQSRGETHQAEARWNYHPNGLWSTFAVGVQKGGYTQDSKSYQVYFNMTWMLDRSQASFRAAQYGSQVQLSGDYRKDYVDTFGTTTTGLTVSHINRDTSVNAYGSRSGSRGDASLNLGHSQSGSNLDFNYRGMVAASKDGVAFGRYSNSGSAMMLQTPDITDTPYGFSVEGSPVGGGNQYAVPLNLYDDIPFARVRSDSEDMDMDVEVLANVVRAHPGQVYPAKARVDVNRVYSGILADAVGNPVSGRIAETGDVAYRNGLFSISSHTALPSITVEQANRRYTCDLRKTVKDSVYRCK
ncbi:TcfC E-set like domain-containing protein [Pseudomonas sp. MCal1]|uniref:TcfC E-set like domain-containing protein n=1 Tax=Pseudomonas sp. MCal1 TaxID=2919887 RepID=UPI0022583B1D|nr:TcfC E-set like domain-containing protein [Pseudomonas sp. MCal1]MCX4220258.1 TcfC E-set like domain-containing protein [Pseudomonas sp. MCal1]